MLILLQCVVLLVSTIWILLKWKEVKKYWAMRNVPYKKPHPVFGSLTFLMKENPGIWMRKLYNEIRSPYVGIWLFWKPSLVINSPEIARRVLVKDAEVFKNRSLGTGTKNVACGLDMFTADDPLWTNVRRKLNSSFTSAKLKIVQKIMLTKSDNLKDRIKEELKNGRIIDLRSLFSDYTTDVIGEAIFSVKYEATLTGNSELRNLTKDLMKFTVMRGIAYTSIFFLPELSNTFGFKFFPKSLIDYLKIVLQTLVKHRGGYETKNISSYDIVDTLIKLKQEATKNGEDIDEDVLVSQAAVLVYAGFDTTAVTLTFSIYELAYHPHIQERLYNEIKDAQETICNGNFDINHSTELPFLNAVTCETLRKYPAMGWLDRKAKADYQIDTNLVIKQGTGIYVNAIGMHYDPVYFPNPENFEPERFLPENKEKIVPYTFMPFGEGPRHCIGKRFAMQSIRFALSSILLNYEVRPIPGAPKPNDCHIENKGVFFGPDDVMSVQFIPRF